MQNFTTNWETISGWPDYQVSDTGLVRNKPTYRLLKPGVTNGGYELVNLFNDGSRKSMIVHRLVANAFIPNPDDKPCVDHIDGDKRNNHVSNLRWATVSENAMNRSRQVNNSSAYKGVCWHKGCNKWKAQIKKDGKNHHLGLFNTPEAASEAYNKAAIELHGDYAKINKPIVKIAITVTLKLS